MNADQINDAMDAVGARLDVLPTTREEGGPINASISDFQDWYWSEYEQWPVNALAQWQTRLRELGELVSGLEQKYAGQGPPVLDEPSGPARQLKDIRVVATWPTWMKVVAGGTIAILLYKVARKTNIL